MFFKKSPLALDNKGWFHAVYAVLCIVAIFLPMSSLSYVAELFNVGGIFYKDEFFSNLFNQTFQAMLHSDDYSLVSFLFGDEGNKAGKAIIGVFLLVHLYLFYDLIVVQGCAPYLVHPKRIKKRIFRRMRHFFKNASNEEIAKVATPFALIVIAIIGFRSEPWFQFWSFVTDQIDIITIVILADLFFTLTLGYLVLYISLSLPVTKDILTESKVYRRLNAMGKPSARWGGIGSYITHDFTELMKVNKNRFVSWVGKYKAPIYLGTTTFKSDRKLGKRHYGLNNHTHMLTIAQTGAGKSRDVLHNNLAIWPQGMFVLDPKGEHAQRMYELRKKAGFPVYVIDPYGLAKRVCPETDRINLLDEIDPNSASAADDIQAITYACIPPDAKETGNSKHFRETAQLLLSGLIAHVLTRFPEEQRNLPTVFDLYMSGKPDGTLLDKKGFYKVLGDMAGNTACGGLPMQAVKMLLDIKEGERGSVYSTFMRSVSWTKSEAIRNTLKDSTFSLDEIKSNNATVFVVLPFSYMKPQARWIRSLIALAFKRSEFPSKEAAKGKVSLFVLDEFLQLETCSAVKDAFSTLRGAGVKLWILVQSLTEMDEYYSNHETIKGACDKQIFGTDNLADCEYFEKILGSYQKILQEGTRENPRTQREIDKLSDTQSIAELISQPEEKEDLGEGYQIVKPVNSLPVVLNMEPCFWNIDKSRIGDFVEVVVPPLPDTDIEHNGKFLSAEEVIEQLEGKTVANKPFTPPAGQKSPLRRDIDNMSGEIEYLKTELAKMKGDQAGEASSVE